MSSVVETSASCDFQILQSITKVTPIWIVLSNQFQFLVASPAFYLLFSFNRRKDISERLNIDQRVYLVAMCKAFDQSNLVLPDSSPDIIGYPNI